MPDKKIIDELKKLLRKAKVTKVQREYAKIEEATMMQLCPIPKPNEEMRFSNRRTLDKYLRKY
ncbi:MAG: hypothetical protein JSW20_13345 [Nitrospiraceae bacterium]|nr:MAG: hypothetical protein JSW20_13345 [Nitrospiraceae bacterium]